ncbi:MAG: c-type cytochrome [Phycisphaerales bacterium]|nr:c-type cytochrome [Phycisphaerales bacterium]
MIAFLPAVLTPAPPGPDWWGALNGLHPIVIHFPIALVITAAFVEFIAMLARRDRPAQFTVISLAVAGVMSVIASWSGWGLADEGYGGGWELDLHRWLGVASSALIILLAICALIACSGSKSGEQRHRWATGTVRAGILVAAALVGVTAHFGGKMVWGDSMVIESLFPPVATVGTDTSSGEDADTATATAATGNDSTGQVDFTSQVLPVISKYCWKCHGPAELGERAKAGLRLGTRSEFFGDENDLVMVKPGDPEGSMLYEVITLPRSDEMAMPPNEAVDPEGIELIRRWIEEGAAFPDGSLVSALRKSTQAAATATPATTKPVAPEPDADSGLDEVRARLKARGVPVRPVAQDTADLEFNANALSHRIDPPFADADLELLDGLQAVLVEVDLSNTAVTDAGVARLAGFDALRSVKLKDTRTGSGAATVLAGLPVLAVVNFYGSDLDDAGLATLAGSKSIDTIYAGETPVTEEGVAAAKAANPGLTIHHKLPSTTIAAPDEDTEAGADQSGPGESGEAVSFKASIKPILEANCWNCHGPEGRAKGDLRLADLASIKSGKNSLLVPGEPDASLLYERIILPRGEKGAMPPRGDGLSAGDIDLIKAWIAAGAE